MLMACILILQNNTFPCSKKRNKSKKKVPKSSTFVLKLALSGAEGGIRTPARFYPPTPLAGAYKALCPKAYRDFANYFANFAAARAMTAHCSRVTKS